jgi:hypothetical protein
VQVVAVFVKTPSTAGVLVGVVSQLLVGVVNTAAATDGKAPATQTFFCSVEYTVPSVVPDSPGAAMVVGQVLSTSVLTGVAL